MGRGGGETVLARPEEQLIPVVSLCDRAGIRGYLQVKDPFYPTLKTPFVVYSTSSWHPKAGYDADKGTTSVSNACGPKPHLPRSPSWGAQLGRIFTRKLRT